MSFAIGSDTEFAAVRKPAAIPLNWRLAIALGFNVAVWAAGVGGTMLLVHRLNLP